jgi:hypothetical protein
MQHPIENPPSSTKPSYRKAEGYCYCDGARTFRQTTLEANSRFGKAVAVTALA